MGNIPLTIPFFTQDEKIAVENVLNSGWVTQGPKVIEFEQAIAEHEGVNHAIATTSCTTALHLSMLVSGMRAGMDVIVPSFTFVATVNAIKMTSAEPVLADVGTDTYNIDPKFVVEIIEKNYEKKSGQLYNKSTGRILWGIVVVHQFGLCADMSRLNEIRDRYNLKILEDSACAIGSRIRGTSPGGFGNVSCLSFHPRKSITTGEGGMILTNDDDIANKARALRSHSASVPSDLRDKSQGFLLPEFNEVGYNYRMSDIQAAIGVAQIKKLDWMLEEKNARAMKYTYFINDNIPLLITPTVPDGYFHSYQSYVCMLSLNELGINNVEQGNMIRNKLLFKLEEHGISTRQGTHAVHTLGYYRNYLRLKPSDLPISYSCDRLSVALPLYAQMSDLEQEEVLHRTAKILDEIMQGR